MGQQQGCMEGEHSWTGTLVCPARAMEAVPVGREAGLLLGKGLPSARMLAQPGLQGAGCLGLPQAGAAWGAAQLHRLVGRDLGEEQGMDGPQWGSFSRVLGLGARWVGKAVTRNEGRAGVQSGPGAWP